MKIFPRKGFDINSYVDSIQSNLRLTKDTKIVSMGSCFAREIKDYLLNNSYNYLLGEKNKDCWVNKELFAGDEDKLKTSHSSIAWERVYHTHTFNQIVKYSFGEKYDRLMPFSFNDNYYIADLLRTRLVYKNIEQANNDIADHIQQSKEMLENAEVLIFTLGLTEVWRFKDFVVGGLHNSIKIKKSFHATSFQENLEQLNEAYSILKEHNPKIKILITVSPVHLLATYRNDLDVVSASCVSKSILRAVADTFCRENEDCYYFPSYEIATIVNPLLGIQTYPKNHHVSKDVVNSIMSAFTKKCLT